MGLVLSWFSDTLRLYLRYMAVGAAFALAAIGVSITGLAGRRIGAAITLAVGFPMAAWAWRRMGKARVQHAVSEPLLTGNASITVFPAQRAMAACACMVFEAVTSPGIGHTSASLGPNHFTAPTGTASVSVYAA